MKVVSRPLVRPCYANLFFFFLGGGGGGYVFGVGWINVLFRFFKDQSAY